MVVYIQDALKIHSDCSWRRVFRSRFKSFSDWVFKEREESGWIVESRSVGDSVIGEGVEDRAGAEVAVPCSV